MKYVLYNLTADGGQPYPVLEQAATGAVFQGGVVMSNNQYLGYLSGTDQQCAAAIAACTAFSMTEIDLATAQAFYESVLTINATTNVNGIPQFITGTQIDGSGYIIVTTSPAPSNWKPNMTVSEHIAQATAVLKTYTDTYTFGHYSVSNQIALTNLLMQAVTLQKQEAITYIQSAWTWGMAALQIYYTKAAALAACTTHAQINAVTWVADFAALDSQDPQVTLAEAQRLIQL